MPLNTDRIQTTHVGSLPRTPQLLEANNRFQAGEIDLAQLGEALDTGVIDVVRKQREIGLDIVNDGEYGHTTSGAVDYGAWWNYSFHRLGGLTPTDEDRWQTAETLRSSPGNIVLTSFPDRRDRSKFREAYEDPTAGVLAHRASVSQPKITGPLTYTGQEAVAGDIRRIKEAMAETGATQGFVAALSPGSCARVKNEYYASDEELVYACADAMREEYKAITDAGLIVQIDDPSIAESWDQINPEPTVEDYLAFTQLRVDALNYALRDLPEEQIRFHLCWGSWHGPHTTDLEFKYLVDLMLTIRAQGYSFEASSPRHGHEWKVWTDHQLPEGKVVYPGFVSHSTNVVEHPELVADRIEQYASVVGKENVIASTDCGLGGRLHPQIALAKLESLVEGARIASQRLF
ncbi:5-methyltetrahydropteroyltriglutamate--homocysteine methyltransferase [Kocuria rhizophila]|uniref:cobalamin-independent methionine synthase II family protein n=1 Tax=Kocuria rhizophila TaxID=72000 RepID=UPI000EDCCBC7|nr:cobalamin-independent methionine synthase II family protein [Kocuria rhizophila]MBK4119995.1 cobalamin-independent methionine synthase II family protein [Kocuria rhizophila]MCC5672302.1 cobalamin-independent methionine synthase II family protein [Kocuria rhizophila]MDV5998209.1 cobalamin-independent methionine synthase II family protein [Kocuria rhizophila]HAG63787.1 epoxyalkane--coenzyme M transferase [Kocuria sp.]